MSQTTLDPLMRRNFLEYASYVIVDRAIPDYRDGCKPVQRRILQTLWEVDDGKFHKVANVVGETMKLHPHGDASIFEALVVMANKEYFIERQGNFGNVITGDRAAAARYIECRLTPLARETLFNRHLTHWQPSYDGRKKEAEFLPAKLPVILLLGIDGIAVGMATKILPHNFCEVLQAQIDLLENRSVELLPDFIQGGLMDASDYDAGRGRIRLRARIEPEGDKRVIIREVPYGTTTEGVIASMEAAAQKGTVKIGSINDYTTDRVEIEVHLARGVYADEVIPQLYAYTDCELSISSNITVIRDGRPWETTVPDLLYESTLGLRNQIKAELEWELEQLEQKHHWLTLEQIFIENRVYKRIEEQTTQAGVTAAVYAGMEPFTQLFIRAMTDDDVGRLLEIRIRRISQYDIDKNRRDIDDIVRAIKQTRAKLRRLTKTTIDYLSGLLEKYGHEHPRRTEITAFETVDIREVARAHHKVNYDKSSGFFGTQVRGSDASVNMSDFDKLLVVCEDGTFRITGPVDKQLLPARAIHYALFDPEAGARFTVVYRDAQRIAYAKKVHILRFINNREYELIKGREGKIAQLIPGDSDAQLHCEFVKAKRQRVTSCDFDLGEVDFSGITARGRRIAAKPVARIKVEK